jgi:hypothetical protein
MTQQLEHDFLLSPRLKAFMQTHKDAQTSWKCQIKTKWSVSTILTARRQLSWPVEAGIEFDCLCG